MPDRVFGMGCFHLQRQGLGIEQRVRVVVVQVGRVERLAGLGTG